MFISAPRFPLAFSLRARDASGRDLFRALFMAVSRSFWLTCAPPRLATLSMKLAFSLGDSPPGAQLQYSSA